MPNLIRLPVITPEALEGAMDAFEGASRDHLSAAAKYMRQHRISHSYGIGNIISDQISVPEKGQMITIPMGTMIWQQNPKSGAYSGRRYEAEVCGIHPGYLNYANNQDQRMIQDEPASISWKSATGTINHISIRNWAEMKGKIIG
jgi:hypothetical protein